MPDPIVSRLAIRGCSIRLLRAGAGPPLVVLHGASGAAWQPFMAPRNRGGANQTLDEEP